MEVRETLVPRRRSQQDRVESTQVTNSGEVQIANPDSEQTPDAVANLDINTDQYAEDTDILESVKMMVLITVVDTHNLEIDEEEEKEKILQGQINAFVERKQTSYENWLRGTPKLLWCDKSRLCT